jgi:hypothetical protein
VWFHVPMSADDDGTGNQHAPSKDDQRSQLMRDSLNELAAGQSGLSFIYSALELLAERYELTDAVIVLENESVGLQIFRLGGRDVSVDLAVRVGSASALYCSPPVVPADELEIVRLACQQALSSPSGPFLTSNSRAFISRALLLIDVVTFIMAVANFHGPFRFFIGLIFGVFVPGWSIVGLLKLKNSALEVSLTLATSLCLIMILAQIMLTVNLWHPIVLQEFICVLSVPSLWWQSMGFQRKFGRAK